MTTVGMGGLNERPDGIFPSGVSGRLGFAQFLVADQLDRLLLQHLPNTGMTQSLQLSFALAGVAATEVRINVTRMTTQFGNAWAEFSLEYVGQIFRADLLQVRFAAPLPVKLREVANQRMFAQRQAMFPCQVEEKGE